MPTLTSDDFAELEGYMAQMDHYMKVDDRPGMRAPHHAFHHLFVAASGPRVSDMIAQLFDHAERYRLRFGATPGVWSVRRAEHRAIIDAAAAGDPELTALRLTEHYARTAALVFAGLDPDHDLAQAPHDDQRGRARRGARARAQVSRRGTSAPALRASISAR